MAANNKLSSNVVPLLQEACSTNIKQNNNKKKKKVGIGWAIDFLAVLFKATTINCNKRKQSL